MQTSELRERLASAFFEESMVATGRLGGSRTNVDIDWASAYLMADVAMNIIKDRATITDLKHKKVVSSAAKFDVLVVVECSCGAMASVYVSPDGVDEIFDLHLLDVSNSS